MRYALCIEYQGNHYKGWQRQHHAVTVQGDIELALSKVLDHEVDTVCAGRTDAGVHATNQVIHFDTDADRPLKAFTMGVNANLPASIAVKWATQVSSDFHARFRATSRRYRYIIYNHPQRPAILHAGVTHVYRELDAALMHAASQLIVGEHDFTSFRAALCQSKSAQRHVHKIDVTRRGQYIIVDITANAFLHHMVRNIVGSLIEVGNRAQPVEWLAQLLAMKDRTKAAATAKPNGLYLVHVEYPEEYGLPAQPPGPLFID